MIARRSVRRCATTWYARASIPKPQRRLDAHARRAATAERTCHPRAQRESHRAQDGRDRRGHRRNSHGLGLDAEVAAVVDVAVTGASASAAGGASAAALVGALTDVLGGALAREARSRTRR